jgi:hypothetical protein
MNVFLKRLVCATAILSVASPALAAHPLSLANAPVPVAAELRAGAELEGESELDTREILLILGAVGAGLLAAVEWWFKSDSP